MDRMTMNRAIAAISVAAIVLLCALSVILSSDGAPNEPSISYEKTGDRNYNITLTYDTEMMGGTVKAELKEGSVTNTCDVTVSRSNDGKVLTGTFATDDAFTDPEITTYGARTNVYSADQMLSVAITVLAMIPLSLILALVAVRALTTSERSYQADGKDIVLYCGIVRHELAINGSVVSRSNTWIPFETAHMEHVSTDGTVIAEVSMMNAPTVSLNGRILRK